MKTLPKVDVAIVGGGWTGLLMSKELGARTGLKVVVLERGQPRNRTAYVNGMDELDYAIRLRMMQDVSRETVTFRHTTADRALPLRQWGSFLPGEGAGGAGEHWQGETPRFFPHIFEMRKRLTERYGAARLPEGCAIQDWGIRYDELEPYYTRAERLLGISGQGGIDPFEGPRSADFPTPPMKLGHISVLFSDAARSLGYHPSPLPSANLSTTYKNPDGIIRPACEYCGFCERFGCMVGAKAQPSNVLLPVIAKQKHVELRTGANVRRIVHKDGQATGVTYIDTNGTECFQPADLVVLSSWTLNNTRLLLLSKIGQAYDPSSASGQVGRNLTHQVMIAVRLLFDKPLNRFMGAGASGVMMGDLDADNFDHTPLDFIGGGRVIVSSSGARPIANFGAVPSSVRSTWGSGWKKAAIQAFDRIAGVSAIGEHPSYRANYLDLDPRYRDQFGDPLLRMTIDYTDNERKLAAYVSAKLAEIGRKMGASEVLLPDPLGRYDVVRYKGTHIQGGTIMGASPATSVLNPWLQHWQVSNLFVLGASAMPQNPSGNPTLTLLAQTMRTADALVGRYLKHPAPLA